MCNTDTFFYTYYHSELFGVSRLMALLCIKFDVLSYSNKLICRHFMRTSKNLQTLTQIRQMMIMDATVHNVETLLLLLLNLHGIIWKKVLHSCLCFNDRSWFSIALVRFLNTSLLFIGGCSQWEIRCTSRRHISLLPICSDSSPSCWCGFTNQGPETWELDRLPCLSKNIRVYIVQSKKGYAIFCVINWPLDKRCVNLCV